MRDIPLLGGALGGLGDVISGLGNLIVGNFRQGFDEIGSGFEEIGLSVVDLAGKAWALPDTAIGLVCGSIGSLVGLFTGTHPGISFGHNAIQFTNNPLMLSAMTFGNVIVYGTDKTMQPNYSSPLVAGGATTGYQEMHHTIQAEVLGPLYFPAHIVSGVTGEIMDGSWHGADAFLETGPHSSSPGPWWWGK